MTGLWFWAEAWWVESCVIWDRRWGGVRMFVVPDSDSDPIFHPAEIAVVKLRRR